MAEKKKKPVARTPKRAPAKKKQKKKAAPEKKRKVAPKTRAIAQGSSTWGAAPGSTDWDTAANWSPASVPSQTATFGTSSQASVTFAFDGNTIDAITFASGAPAYTFAFTSNDPSTPTLTIGGTGVSNASSAQQTFAVAASSSKYQNAQLVFINSASAGGSNLLYTAGPTNALAAGGGVIGFLNTSSAGSAWFRVTTGAGTPHEPSLVGAEVSFSDSSTASNASFVIYGSTSTTDGDTFGNVVFHDTTTAANARFTNIGGTVNGGDGGNTQFYDQSTAGSAVFHNYGGTVSGANGGDVAFDGTATASQGQFHNYAATVDGAYGGVTSFNNNPPQMAPDQGASAGFSFLHNYGSTTTAKAGGGHTELTGIYGSGTCANAAIINHGSGVAGGEASSAGHTILSVDAVREKDLYQPSAGNAIFWNFPGTVADAPGGFTELTVYSSDAKTTPSDPVFVPPPTAAYGTFINQGGRVAGAGGGYTTFGASATAANAQLIAIGGAGGNAGEIRFYDSSDGGSASVQLYGYGVLDISYHDAPGVSLGPLQVNGGGVVKVALGNVTTQLTVTSLTLGGGAVLTFSFYGGTGFATGTPYAILVAPNLSSFSPSQFAGNDVQGASPTFSIDGTTLNVVFD